VTRPTAAGRLVYLAGNDGTGKTTQAQLLLADLAADGQTARYLWLRFPQYLSLPVLILSRAMRITRYRTVDGRRIGSWEFHRAPWLAHLLLWTQVVDAWIARARQIRPILARSEAVVLDRFVYDIVVDIATAARDPQLLRSRPARLLCRLVQPVDVVILDAPAAVIRERRPDVAVDEDLAVRADLYRALGQQLGVRRVDASQDSETVHLVLSKGLAR
jgi:thymidylate kinase